MNLILLTPGAGAMYCGGCLRDNALAAALRQAGHEVTMVPLYLPLTLDEPDQSAGTRIFFGGINVYLQQKFPLFRLAPRWFFDLLTAPGLLKWAGGKAASTRPADVGELTLSMLKGEAGNQARELDQLIVWLKTQPRPDVICLSNALLAGMIHRLKAELGAPVVVGLQGEDSFLDSLPESHRAACWQTLARRAAEADLFISPSRYFADLMARRLSLAPEKVRVVWNGISLDGYGGAEVQRPTSKVQSQQAGAAPLSNPLSSPLSSASHEPPPARGLPSVPPLPEGEGRGEGEGSVLLGGSGVSSADVRSEGCSSDRPFSTKDSTKDSTKVSQALLNTQHATRNTLGFFARMAPEKGLDTLVEAFIRLRQRGRVKDARLRVGGSCGPVDELFVNSLRRRLGEAGLASEVEFHPNLDRAAKLAFLRSLTVFSVPALYGEAFGLYVIEALASGVPVVQPDCAAFPELLAATGGGIVCTPGNPQALAEAIEGLLLDPARARALGNAGRRAVFQNFSAEAMAKRFVELVESAICANSRERLGHEFHECSAALPLIRDNS